MSAAHVIVWDLDGTIGDFSALEKHNGEGPVRVQTRPGLAASLEALRREGFAHSLLTLATPRYAELALRGTGLFEHFARIEGAGQRGKGDAAGVASAFGIPAAERPHRVLFVGDRMIFDEPQDPEVVFHLEPFALLRPAEHLQRLVLRLRDAGTGSLRLGFRALGLGPRRWYRLGLREALVVGKPARRSIEGLDPLVLMERPGQCPVIGYERAPTRAAAAQEHTFIPAQVVLAGN